MATVVQLTDAGLLHKFDPVLDPDEQELRLLHTSDKLKGWLENALPNLTSQWDIETSPLEQLDALIAIYAEGLPLVFERQFKAFHRKPIEPAGDGVWYLKTADLRVFGWFWKKDCFIGVVADTAERVKTYPLYQGYRGEVIRFREALDLDEPKFIPGEDPDAVISNYDLPD
jgi:hypothetical protein